MNRILVSIDFSDMTDAVVDQAVELARAQDSRLWLLHVAPPNPEFVGFEAGPQSVRDVRAEHYRDEHRHLQELAAQLNEQGVACEALLVQGMVVEEILDHAARLDADAIVLGSHGHGALYHLLLGSVTEAVVRAATCPIVIVPAKRQPN